MFADEKEKQAAITHLPSLKEHPGWKFIEKALAADMTALEAQLRDRKDFASLEELYKIQDLRNATEAFKNLPERIIAEARDVIPEDEEEDLY